MAKASPPLPSYGQSEERSLASNEAATSNKTQEQTAPISDSPPSQKDIDQALTIPILDSDGKAQLFGDLFKNANSDERRAVMVIFVRHFFCGSCQDYIQTLSSAIPSAESLPPGTSLVVIGCGATSLIPMYKDATSCPFPIYTDPTSRLYSIFGMTRTWSLGPVPQYLRHSTLALVMKGIAQGLGRTFSGDALKSGDMAQVGGEILFDVRPAARDGQRNVSVSWCHRMKTTRDHTEIPALKQIMGFQ